MHCLQIFLVFFLFLITFSLHAESLHSKSYQEISLSLNKSIHISDIIMNQHLFWPSTWSGTEDNVNWKLHDFIAYLNRKWKEQANQNRLNKKKQFGQENLQKPNVSIHLSQERYISKLDQGSQQNQSSVQTQISGNVSCEIPKWVNKNEIGKSLPIFYSNPCQPDPGQHCEFIYKNFILKEKFIQCDKSGKALVKSCPQNFKWDNKLQKCSYSYILLNNLCSPSWVNQSEIGLKLPSFIINSCKKDDKRTCEFTYIKYKYDDKKFIQCDRLGNAVIKSCPPSFKWDTNSNECSLKTTMIMTSTEKSKETGTTFSIRATIPESTKNNLCSPSWVNQGEVGVKYPPYAVNPCKPDDKRTCEFTYMKYKYDDNKFIQCDRLGHAVIKSCPPSFKWDTNSNQCSLKTTMIMTSTERSKETGTISTSDIARTMETTFSVRATVQESTKTNTITTPESTSIKTPTSQAIKNMSTLPTSNSTESKVETTRNSDVTSNINITIETKQPCLIPFWVNQTDNGTKLPIFYINPCKPQPTSHCEFTYKHFDIDDSKFIQCDRSGNARVKSCPTSFKWDNSVGQCSPEVVTTTMLPCLIPYWVNQTDNGAELPNYYINPCKPQPTRHCEFTYKHFDIDDSKFIQCDRSGNARVKSCPTSFKWDNSVDQCSPEVVTTTMLPCLIPSWVNQTDNGAELPNYYINPCKPQPTSHCEFTYKHFDIDDSKFIQCDRSGNARVKSCPTSFKWDNSVDQCSPEVVTTTMLPCLIPSWVNQTDNGAELPNYYINPCKRQPTSHCEFTYKHFDIDDSKFIQCDRSGNARVKSCPTSFKWDNSVDQCSPEVVTTTMLPCLIPSWVNQTDNGAELPNYYINPCKRQPTRHCEFTYKHFDIDDSKFIQCDRFGNARLKSCPTSFKWDNNVDQCSPEFVTTTMLPCLIPSWVNQTDNGAELSNIFVNPCTPQPTSHCEFTYKQFAIDDSKFIQCDRSGNARVKSCPTSFKWDNSVDQCSPEVVTTTMLPCLIPSWVNQTDNGAELSNIFVNPCTPQPTSHCEFTYKQFAIDDSKFIQCDRSGNARVKSCPTSFKWDNSVDQCSPEVVTTTMLPCLIPSWVNQTDNGAELSNIFVNPCTPQPTSHCEFTYKQFAIDDSKFIQCDRSGNARVKSCPTSFKWDNSVDQCSPEVVTTTMLPCLIPSWVNQTDNGAELSNIFVNPCTPQPTSHCEFTYKQFAIDDSKFIQCDRSGNARVKSCPTSFKWDNSVDQCSPEVVTTTMLPCLIPSWVNQTDNGAELSNIFVNPCTPQPTSHCEFTYKQFAIDDSKFIQCDRSGNARVKSCPTSFKWDNSVDQCSPEVVTTTMLPCLIPSWVNQTDNGAELSNIFVNPCTPQPTSHCEFTYKQFAIDDSKFIQCDRSGNARVKSCPTSFKWDNSVDQCSPEVVTTTMLPCLIPSWVNQTDNGAELSNIFVNPCTPQPTSHCEFTYKQFAIDDSKFIQCDRSGNARVKSCPTSFKWDNSIDQCSPEFVTTTMLPCLIPSWVNQTDNGAELSNIFVNPCTPQPTSHCEFTYKQFAIDDSKFIQCDRSGNARVKSCPTSFKWDNSVDQCSPEFVTTTMLPQCEVPALMDEKEKGIPLKPFYPNPCPVDSSRNCEFIYLLYVLDQHKFIQCDRSGHAVIKSCLPSSIWDNHIKQCSIENTQSTTKPQCEVPALVDEKEKGIPLKPFYPNPCPVDSSRNCEFIYLLYVLDQHKFIQCDRSGHAVIKSCLPSSIWDNHIKQCSIENTQSTTKPQCEVPALVDEKEKGIPLKPFYPNPCPLDSSRNCEFIYLLYVLDQHKFIQCDRSGHAVIKSCLPSSIWDNHIKQCSIENTQSTTKPQCEVPALVDEKEKGIPLKPFYPNPCPLDSSRNCEFIYLLYVLDQHKFIQCDRFGHAVIKSCPPSSIWDNLIKQCSTQNIMTTLRPACTVPKWMNPNEKGLPLRLDFPNPCKSTLIQTCKYFTYIINDHKFIECDQYGKAWVKTCPPISKWDSIVKMCTTMNDG